MLGALRRNREGAAPGEAARGGRKAARGMGMVTWRVGIGHYREVI